MEYTLDAKSAAKADILFSKIEEKGKYHGAFTRAEQVVSKNGAKGVDFSFKDDTGASADYLTIWTHKRDGSINGRQYDIFMAIMTCLRVKSLKAELGEVEKYDSETKQRVKAQVLLFKELMNKPIGLLLHMEEYEKTAGGTAWKPVISAPFDKDGFTASEILSQAKTASTLEKMEAGLRDRPLKPGSSSNHATDSTPSSQPTKGSFDDLSDDIPF